MSGDVYNSPTHLSAFTQEFLRILLVREAKDITSALHFKSTTAEIERNLMQMCSEDIHATGLGENDVVIALAADTGQWYAGRIMESDKCEKKSIKISEKDGHAFDLIDKQVDLVKYTGALESLENAIFAVEANPLRSGFEMISYLHIKKSEIQAFMKGLYVGTNTFIRLHEVDPNLVCSLKISKPEIKMGKIGSLDGKILLKPAQVFRDFNLILCISTGNNSSNSTIPILNKNSVLESLEGIEDIVPEIGEYIQSLDSELTIQQCAIINCLLTIELFMLNRTEGKFALIQNGRHLSKFTIQKRNEIQNYVEFENDMKSEEVLASLIFHLIDTSSESFDKTNELDAYRAIAEFLEDFGAERPTLILLLTDGGVEFSNNLQGYLGAIKEHSRYELDILGLGNQFNPLDYQKIHENMRCRIYPVNELHHIQFQGYLVSSIESLIPSPSDKKK